MRGNVERGRYRPGGRLAAFATLVLMAVILAGALRVYVQGVYVVEDEENVVVAVLEESSSERRLLRRLPNGTWVGFQTLEGELVVKCRNRARLSLGYITSMTSVRRSIRNTDCWPMGGDRVIG